MQSVSPTHGRVLIYVWAIEQDELSKRNIPTSTSAAADGQDVFVPWTLSSPVPRKTPKVRTKRQKKGVVTAKDPEDEPLKDGKREPQVFDRYYHMFAKGELRILVCEAAEELGLSVGDKSNALNSRGIEIVQDGWERSNYYVEIRTWES